MKRKEGAGQNPGGLCMCGCGERTPLAKSSDRGDIIGTPRRWVPFHDRRAKAMAKYAVTPSGCWEWQGSVTKMGYGLLEYQHAHRVFWKRLRGPIPAHLEPDHLCRNKRCVNPDHIELVTPTENKRRSSATKLKADQVAQIKALAGIPGAILAARFGVSPSNISHIRRGASWCDIAPAAVS